MGLGRVSQGAQSGTTESRRFDSSGEVKLGALKSPVALGFPKADKIAYFIRKTTYSNRKGGIIDFNKLLI